MNKTEQNCEQAKSDMEGLRLLIGLKSIMWKDIQSFFWHWILRIYGFLEHVTILQVCIENLIGNQSWFHNSKEQDSNHYKRITSF